MTTDATILEDVAAEMMIAEPEVIDGPNVQIEFPYKDIARLSNFIRFYHPDGTYSDIAAPTYNPARPTSYRRRFLQHWLSKRGPNGARWYFLTPQAQPPEAPFRCFVAPGGRQCTKKLRSIPDLYMHVMSRHGEESKLYADVLESMKRKMQAQLDPEIIRSLGLGETTKTEGEPSLHYCRIDGCPRFFDTEEGRALHEYRCPQKKEKVSE